MVCQSCGAEVNADAFCSRCGAQIAVPPQAQSGYPVYPPAMYMSRVARHLRTLGILWCVYGLYHLVKGLLALTFLSAFTVRGFTGEWPYWAYYHGPSPAPWMHALVPVVATMTMVWTALLLLTGYALLTRRTWGRVLAIVAGVLSLIAIPFGTAMGIYTLWVLASGVSGMEYEAIADHR